MDDEGHKRTSGATNIQQRRTDPSLGMTDETDFAQGRATFFEECYSDGEVIHRVLSFALAWTEAEEISGDDAEDLS